MHTANGQHDYEKDRQHHHKCAHFAAARNVAVIDPEVLVLRTGKSHFQRLLFEIILTVARDFLRGSKSCLAAGISRLVVCDPSCEIVCRGQSRLYRCKLYKRVQGSCTKISERIQGSHENYRLISFELSF